MPKLTKRVIDALEPAAGPSPRDFFVWDDELPGFGVRVRPTGRKTYVLQFRDAAHASRRVIIGDHGPYTPQQARETAATLRAAVLEARRNPQARDPARRRTDAQTGAKAARATPTVAEVADAFLAECRAKLKPSTAGEYARQLGVGTVRRGPAKGSARVGPLRAALGRLKITDVTRAQVAALHLRMAPRPYAANRALALLASLFTYAERQGLRPERTNPCYGITPYRESARERYLTDDEFAAVGAALERAASEGLPLPPIPRTATRRRATGATTKHRTKDTAGDGTRALRPFNPVGIAAVRFLLLTGWREQEALLLEWHQVDFERGIATLPDTKSGRSVRELGTPALAVLRSIVEYRHAGTPYVFPGAKPGRPYRDLARVWNAVRHAAGVPDVRIHDLRHAFASVGASRGLTLPLIGGLLGHRDSATTARYAHLTDPSRRRAAETTAGAVAAALAPTTPPSEISRSETPPRDARRERKGAPRTDV